MSDLTTPTPQENKLFSHRTLRLLIGFVAFLLPITVLLLADAKLPSISAHYYSEGGDVFVGMLFVVGALMIAYNGNKPKLDSLPFLRILNESVASKTAGAAAFCIALFPASPPNSIVDPTVTELLIKYSSTGSDSPWVHTVHYLAAFTMFSILAYFCFGPFRNNFENLDSVKEGRRSRIYLICGWIIALSILAIGVEKLLIYFYPPLAGIFDELQLTLWAEWIALGAFGVAWITAGKIIPYLTANEELLIRWGVSKEKTV
jgi:hypothetical protein